MPGVGGDGDAGSGGVDARIELTVASLQVLGGGTGCLVRKESNLGSFAIFLLPLLCS